MTRTSIAGAAFGVVLAAVLPGAALASSMHPHLSADVFAGEAYSLSGTLDAGDASLAITLDIEEALMIDAFALSGSGTNFGMDLSEIRFGFQAPLDAQFDHVISFDGVSEASAFDVIYGRIFAAGETVTLTFAGHIQNPASVTVSFDTAPIPVPAAGGLLLAALTGLGLARRTKAAQTA